MIIGRYSHNKAPMWTGTISEYFWFNIHIEVKARLQKIDFQMSEEEGLTVVEEEEEEEEEEVKKEEMVKKTEEVDKVLLRDQFALFSKFGDKSADGKTIKLSQSDKWFRQVSNFGILLFYIGGIDCEGDR